MDFETSSEEFYRNISSAKQRLESAGDSTKDVEARKQALRRVEMDLDEADEMLSQMESSLDQMYTRTAKAGYTTRLRAAKTELSRSKKVSKDLHAALSRSDLLASSPSHSGGFSYAVKRGGSDDPYGNSGEPSERTRLLAGSQVLSDGQRRLQESQRIALESEDMGADILRNLIAQREQISGARQTLDNADQHVDRAGGTIKGMIRTMHQQRLVLTAMIFVLILVVLFILYMKLWR